ncbi:MAG: protein-L-isoaspartate O-methyltransferase family protein [Pseudonocardiaceae bacterium]
MSLAHDLVTDAAAALDYDSYVRQPDGSALTQSTARDTIVRMCRLLEPRPGLRVLEVGTGSGYTSALLGRIVGDRGSVVSLDIDAHLTKRARITHARTKHTQGNVGTVAVHTTDGYLGWAAGAPYDRIIGWATPHLLPGAWVEQAADRAVIVTPVTVAPIAQAHLLLRVDLHHGRAIPRDVHAGGFIEMCPEVITEVAVPIRYRDALDGGGSAWVSAPAVRGDPERAHRAARMIAAGRSVPSSLDDDYLARSAFYGYLYARRPHGLASAGFSGIGLSSASGMGLVLADSAAVLRPRDMLVAGTGQAEESLRALITEWAHAGRPDHTALQPILIPDSAGFRVEVGIRTLVGRSRTHHARNHVATPVFPALPIRRSPS